MEIIKKIKSWYSIENEFSGFNLGLTISGIIVLIFLTLLMACS
jgi:hypothetical protein